jgi:hypothetical protein
LSAHYRENWTRRNSETNGRTNEGNQGDNDNQTGDDNCDNIRDSKLNILLEHVVRDSIIIIRRSRRIKRKTNLNHHHPMSNMKYGSLAIRAGKTIGGATGGLEVER